MYTWPSAPDRAECCCIRVQLKLSAPASRERWTARFLLRSSRLGPGKNFPLIYDSKCRGPWKVYFLIYNIIFNIFDVLS